jgi:hypothetical protein
MKNRSFLPMWALMVAFCAIAYQPTLAQKSAEPSTKPRVSFSIVSPGEALPWIDVQRKPGASLTATDTVPTILMRERAISFFRRDSAFQTGSIAINRVGGGTEMLLVVAYSMEYLDSALRPLPNISSNILTLPVSLPAGAIVTPPFPASLPIAIGGLQGDLAPTTADANGQLVSVAAASKTLPNTANIQPGQTRVLINFTARWSDQSYSPRSAALQGRRYVRLTLLRVNDFNYEVGVTLATVILDDPQRVAPILANAIQNKQLLRTAGDLIELESPGFRSDGQPNSVFYDENYNPLTYTATSSDSTIVTATARQSDTRVGGRPSLFYAVQPGALAGSTVSITVIADDGTGLLARDAFSIQVVNNITAVASAPEMALTVSPNPTADRVNIESVAQQTGRVRVRIVNALGLEVMSSEQDVSAGATYRHAVDMSALSTGVYMVEVQDGAARNIRKMVKN